MAKTYQQSISIKDFFRYSHLKINFYWYTGHCTKCICLYFRTMETPDAMLIYDKYDEMVEMIEKWEHLTHTHMDIHKTLRLIDLTGFVLGMSVRCTVIGLGEWMKLPRPIWTSHSSSETQRHSQSLSTLTQRLNLCVVSFYKLSGGCIHIRF